MERSSPARWRRLSSASGASAMRASSVAIWRSRTAMSSASSGSSGMRPPCGISRVRASLRCRRVVTKALIIRRLLSASTSPQNARGAGHGGGEDAHSRATPTGVLGKVSILFSP